MKENEQLIITINIDTNSDYELIIDNISLLPS